MHDEGVGLQFRHRLCKGDEENCGRCIVSETCCMFFDGGFIVLEISFVGGVFQEQVRLRGFGWAGSGLQVQGH
jgi:hypothetical protein